MFAKILKGERGQNGFRYITDVKDIDTGPIDTFFKESLRQQGYENIPDGEGETFGRCATVLRQAFKDNPDELEEVRVFCNDYIYLCSETGQTVDRIACNGGGGRNV